MKKCLTLITVLVMVAAMALFGAGCSQESSSEGEGAGVLNEILGIMTAEDSGWTEYKQMYQEMDPDIKFTETADEEKMNITIEGGGMDGSWTYALDGDYITSVTDEGDYTGVIIFQYICEAAGVYMGYDGDLFLNYLFGLSMLEIENDKYVSTTDEDGTSHQRLYIGGDYDMAELNEMYVSDKAFDIEALSDGDDSNVSSVYNIGKISMAVNGTKDDLTMVIGEYDGLDELALKSAVTYVSKAKPDNYKEFVKEYTEIGEKTGDDFEAVYLTEADQDAIDEIGVSYNSKYKYIRIHIGDTDSSDQDD